MQVLKSKKVKNRTWTVQTSMGIWDVNQVPKPVIQTIGPIDLSKLFCQMVQMLICINLNMKVLEESCATIKLFIQQTENLLVLMPNAECIIV